jgi:hypothetical protein
MQEAVPKALNRFANAGNFGNVHPGPDDHLDIVGTPAPGCPDLFGQFSVSVIADFAS